MRPTFIILISILIAFNARSQNCILRLESVDNVKAPMLYPESKIEIPHQIKVVGNLCNPLDSITQRNVLYVGIDITPDSSEVLSEKTKKGKANFTIIVDTSNYLEKKICFFKPKTDNETFILHRREIKTQDFSGEVRTQNIDRDTTIVLLTQPVLISNLSDNDLYLVAHPDQFYVTQQAKNKKNKWVDIETTSSSDDCSLVTCVYQLKKNDFILTEVMRFKGDYKTELRIKIVANDKLFYSAPYPGSIDYRQLKDLK